MSNHKLSLLTNFKEEKFEDSVFKKLNAINSILSSSKNCSLYSYEEKNHTVILIIRKLDDGRGNLWRVKIGRKFINNLQSVLRKE